MLLLTGVDIVIDFEGQGHEIWNESDLPKCCYSIFVRDSGSDRTNRSSCGTPVRDRVLDRYEVLAR